MYVCKSGCVCLCFCLFGFLCECVCNLSVGWTMEYDLEPDDTTSPSSKDQRINKVKSFHLFPQHVQKIL